MKGAEVLDRVVAVEDCRTGDDEVGLHSGDLGNGVFFDGTIDADKEVGLPGAENFNLGREVVEEGVLPGVRADAKDEDVVDLIEVRLDGVNGGSGVEGDTSDDLVVFRNEG